MSTKNDIVDLTHSFTLSNHSSLRDEIINLDSDDSLIEIPEARSSHLSSEKSNKQALKILHMKKKPKVLGDCPICWDELGKNPLASTKCGHVFCMKCLENSLKIEQKCPNCRHVLKGASAYHPLYLHIEH